jgi:hypothetical protein
VLRRGIIIITMDIANSLSLSELDFWRSWDEITLETLDTLESNWVILFHLIVKEGDSLEENLKEFE